MREDQFAVTITIDGEPLGIFDKFDGGETSAEETKYKPGGMQPQKSLGGSSTTDNITVSRLVDNVDREDSALVKRLRPRVGKAECVASQQPLDIDGNPFGKPDVFTGKLQRVAGPGHDSEGSGPSLFELEISTEGTVG